MQIFLPASPTAVKMEELRASKRQDGLLFRLKLLQFFVELLEARIEARGAGSRQLRRQAAFAIVFEANAVLRFAGDEFP